jgi:hypothetical protein
MEANLSSRAAPRESPFRPEIIFQSGAIFFVEDSNGAGRIKKKVKSSRTPDAHDATLGDGRSTLFWSGKREKNARWCALLILAALEYVDDLGGALILLYRRLLGQDDRRPLSDGVNSALPD